MDELKQRELRLRGIVDSPEWSEFRLFFEREIRSYFLAAIDSKSSEQRLEALAGARALLGFIQGFSTELYRLEKYMTAAQIESDVREARSEWNKASQKLAPWSDE